MRILHIYKDYYPVLGGIENHIKQLAEAQVALGHQVSVLVTSRDRHTHVEIVNGVRVIFAGRLTTVSSTPLSVELPLLLRKEQPDIAHLQFPYPPGELANYYFGRARATVLSYQSDIVRQTYLRLVYAPFMRRVLARVDTILASSPNYVESSPVLFRYRDKVRVIPLGIDPAPFVRAADSNRQASRSDTRELLFVGRLRYYKGLAYLISALPQIHDAHLTIVGTGPMEGDLRELAAELEVEGRVTFAGDVSENDLPAYYANGDMFVLPASERSEAFGLVQLEAMAAGKPVVSTRLGTGVEWVNQDGVTGLTVPPRDSAALAGAINSLLADPGRRERMGQAARARVVSEFTLQKMVDRVMKVYGECLQKSGIESHSPRRV